MNNDDCLAADATPHWECNEIIVSIHGPSVVLHEKLTDDGTWMHGYAVNASISLTLDEAKELCDRLNKAITSYQKSERDCQEYFRKQREKEGGDSETLNFYSAPDGE